MISTTTIFLAFCQCFPTFAELERVFHVSESVPSGHHIGFVRGDHGEPLEAQHKQNFFVVFPPAFDGRDNGGAERLLDVDERSGEIAVRSGQSIDYERDKQLFVLAVPVDGSAPISVIVKVQDENDNVPQFPVQKIKLEISEYARINTALSLPLASDPDSPPFNVQRYRIAAGNVNNAFRLISKKDLPYLELAVNGRLDREYREHYELTVEAIDGGKPPKIGILKVQIDVLDANDNHPEFLQIRYSARISPNTAPGIPILRMSARDPDSGNNGHISYAIISQSLISPAPSTMPSSSSSTSTSADISLTPFQLDSQSGTLSLARPLPDQFLQHPAIFELLIVARDHGVPDALESSTTLEVIVETANNGGFYEDRNEQKTQIGIIWLTEDGTGGNVPEGLPLGYVLARISIDRVGAVQAATEDAEIADKNLNLSLLGAQSMVCLRQTDTPNIHLLIVCGQLDREQSAALQLDILLRNSTDVLLDHPLRLVLRDVNDNAPRWNQTAFRFRWVLGADEDDEDIDESRQNGSMDQNRNNDNIQNYIRLVATDADTGDNARIRYGVVGTDGFKIEPELGILTLDEDKFSLCPSEKGDELTFQVLAEDHGHPSALRSLANITIRFVHSQQNAEAEHRVRFTQPVYEVELHEGMQPGTCVLQINAVEETICGTNKTTSNGLHYWLSEESELFKLDPDGGMLCTKKGLEFERIGENLELKAMAKNSDGDEASVQILLHLHDINNHAPVFQPREYALLLSPDNLQPLVPLLRVRAVDADTCCASTCRNTTSSVNGSGLRYRLGPGIGAELFELDELDGVLALSSSGAQKLGTMEGGQNGDGGGGMFYGLELRAEAEDGDGRKSSEMALIRIRLLPSHLHCMSFSERVYRFRVSEETLLGIRVGDLRVVDVAEPDRLRFEIVHPEKSVFGFDESKSNRLLLERELDADVIGGEAHLLNIKAMDTVNNCTNFTQVFIDVVDVNDNGPKFGQKTGTVRVPENHPIHKPFYIARATDHDKYDNGRISYELYGTVPSSVPVQVHSETGAVSLSASLDVDIGAVNQSIQMLIHARDHGIPSRFAEMELLMIILDVNDNMPMFEAPEYNIEVPEDAEPITILHRVRAKDADLTVLNRRIRYRIIQLSPETTDDGAGDQQEEAVLGINARTGEVFLRRALDREKFARYSFEIEARDGGNPARRSKARLHLRVVDVNDNAPNCSQIGVVRVRAGMHAREHVARLHASDPDEKANVRFRLQQSNEVFELSADGDLFLRHPISPSAFSDPHFRASLLRSFSVIAEDQSVEMPLSTVCQVFVEIQDDQLSNNNGSVLSASELVDDDEIRLIKPIQRVIKLDPEASPGTELIRVNATGVQRWSIQADGLLTYTEMFSVSSDGTIRLRTSLNDSIVSALRSLTVRMDSSQNSVPKYLTFLLRRNDEYGKAVKTSKTNDQRSTLSDEAIITLPTNWSNHWRKPLYEPEIPNRTARRFYRMEALDDASEEAIQAGLFELDELHSAFYLTNLPKSQNFEFILRISGRSNDENSENGQEENVQILTFNLAEWKRSFDIEKRRPKCAKMHQKWNVSEAAPIGTFVGRIYPQNFDGIADYNSTRKFELIEGALLFRVDAVDGSVYTQKAMTIVGESHILVAEISDREANLATRCVVRIDIISAGDEVATFKRDLQFVSAPNLTIFLANLEKGLYPGNVVHHFVAVREQRPSFNAKIVNFDIIAGNGANAFILDRNNGALSVPSLAKVGGATIYRLIIRASFNNNNKTEHRRIAHIDQPFMISVDHSNRQFTYFGDKNLVAKVIIGENERKLRHQRQFVAKFRRKDQNDSVKFGMFPHPLEGFQLGEDDGILEYSRPANGDDNGLLLKYGQNLSITVLAFLEHDSSSLPKQHPYVDGVDYASLTIIFRRAPQTSSSGPKIEQSSCGNISVPENLEIEQLLRVRLVEPGSGPAGIVFGIESGSNWHEAKLFTIDPISGWISARELDREQKQEHLLMISAIDVKSSPRRADMCTVRVRVVDTNDNVPVFDPAISDQIELPKWAIEGHILAKLEAKDADEGENGQIRMVLEEDGSGEMFDLDPQSGELTFARATPFMAEHSGAWITARALDNGHAIARKSDPLRIRINWEKRAEAGRSGILAFARKRYLAVVEEGRPWGQFVAKLELLHPRNCSQQHSSVSYSIPSGNHDSAFAIDRSGKVQTALELDAEIRSAYSLHVVAISGCGRAETLLDVRVADADDNAPFLSRADVAIRVSEDLPIGSLVTLIGATVADISPTLLEYSIFEGSSKHFEVNRWTGKVHLVEKLDYERAQRHVLRVQVAKMFPNGLNSRATANLSIEVLDTNDNAPKFAQSFIEIKVPSEEIVAGKILLSKLEATDGDGSAQNAKIRYEFGENSNSSKEIFDLNAENGQIRLRKALTSDTANVDHFVTVKAVDSGNPPMFAFCTIRIQFAPSKQHTEFSHSNYTFTLPENLPVHTPIGHLSLRSPPPQPLNCQFGLSPPESVGGSSENGTFSGLIPSDFFHLSFDGQLLLKRPLDREQSGEWTEMIATLHGCPPPKARGRTRQQQALSAAHQRKALIRIRVADVNDNAPHFEAEANPRDVWISDAMGPGTVLARFNATDRDASDLYSLLTYRLLAGDDFEMFRLDSETGELRLLKWNDSILKTQHSFGSATNSNTLSDLIISAQDGGSPPRVAEWVVQLKVDWTEWSGSQPQFPVPIYRKAFPEDTFPGNKLFTVRAERTEDNNISAACIYAIERPAAEEVNEIFSLDSRTGEISLIGSLDLEASNGFNASMFFHFNVSCRSSKSKVLRQNETQSTAPLATVPAEIYVIGVDEFAPIFTRSSYTFRVSSDFEPGSRPIGQLDARDRDIGFGHRIRYLLDPADTRSTQFIRIDPDNGAVGMIRIPPLSSASQNGSEPKIIRFTVWAESSPKHRSSATVYIEMGASWLFDHRPVDEQSQSSSIFFALLSLFLCFGALSILVISRVLLRRHRSLASKSCGSVSKKRMFSVSNCRALQQMNATATKPAGSALSPTFESGQFSHSTHPPGEDVDGEAAKSAFPRSASSSANYMNITHQQRPPQLMARAGAGSRRSAPDSGIDPDVRSVHSAASSEDSCALADAYLCALGVVEEVPFKWPIGVEKQNAGGQQPAAAAEEYPPKRGKSHRRHRQQQQEEEEAAMEELIYAKMDEILPPPPPMQFTRREIAADISAKSCTPNLHDATCCASSKVQSADLSDGAEWTDDQRQQQQRWRRNKLDQIQQQSEQPHGCGSRV